MTASGHPPNHLLQLLDAADFDLLRPHLATVEMVRKSVLREVGSALRYVYFPHGGSVSIRVGLPEGQMIEVAMLGVGDDVLRLLFGGEGPPPAPDGNRAVTGTQRNPCMPTCTQRRRPIATDGQLVPIANISRREHDGAYPRRT
ncbi:hypothetical protein [Bradyrhizobium japonicum]|uniref:hypothetical protein n=1 Tax=Bradyrhizobium japonicum TaxID=375 RepID=UPI002013672B|nr:hypothetical protein [Bradyrhizobium japonicum]